MKRTMESYVNVAPAGAYTNYALWFVQILLTLAFLLTGGMKLVMPIADLYRQMPIHLPEAFVRFLGACEFLGALGLVLPGSFRIKEWLTPLAAAGLAIIGLLAGLVAFGRRR